MPWGKKVSEEICRQDVSREPSTGRHILVPFLVKFSQQQTGFQYGTGEEKIIN